MWDEGRAVGVTPKNEFIDDLLPEFIEESNLALSPGTNTYIRLGTCSWF